MFVLKWNERVLAGTELHYTPTDPRKKKTRFDKQKRASTHFTFYFCDWETRIPCGCKSQYLQKLWTLKISSVLLKVANPYIFRCEKWYHWPKAIFPDDWKNAHFSGKRKLTTTDRYLSAREWRTCKNSKKLRGRRVELIEMEVQGRHSPGVGYKL